MAKRGQKTGSKSAGTKPKGNNPPVNKMPTKISTMKVPPKGENPPVNTPAEHVNTSEEPVNTPGEIVNKPAEPVNIPVQPVNKDDFTDLKALLSPKTETKTPGQQQPQPGTQDANSGQQSAAPPPDPNDFKAEEPKQEKPEEKTSSTQAKTAPPMSKDKQAVLLIAFVDGLGTLTLPWAYMRTIFDRNEYKRLKELQRKIKETKGKKVEEIIEDKDWKLYQKYLDYKELCDELPFTDDEVALLKDPLQAVMEKYNWNVGPEMLLVGAVFTVMSPRLMPLLMPLDR